MSIIFILLYFWVFLTMSISNFLAGYCVGYKQIRYLIYAVLFYVAGIIPFVLKGVIYGLDLPISIEGWILPLIIGISWMIIVFYPGYKIGRRKYLKEEKKCYWEY